MKAKTWICGVCGYTYEGNTPPEECPQCSSPAAEFQEKKAKTRLEHDGKKFDVLLINGSSHRKHNTAILADHAEKKLKEKNASYRRFDLNTLDIRHCWCCYSIEDNACTYPCRNQLDDMPALHKMLVDSKALIVATPINWNNMSARLKDFLDRTTCLQNLCLTKKKSLTAGKTAGILVTGHEDGALKTAMDVFVYLQQMGYVLAPYGFAYRTHGAEHNAKTDRGFLEKDEKTKEQVEGVVENVLMTIEQDLETKLRDRIKPVCE